MNKIKIVVLKHFKLRLILINIKTKQNIKKLFNNPF